MPMPIITRFAPSPTGELHLGHAWAAKVAHDLARSTPDGSFLLRIENIDHTRSKAEFEDLIQTDLQWLGFAWDREILRQSERLAAYETALEELRHRTLVYPCFCTRKEIQSELASMVAAPHQLGEQPYPGTCRHRSADERQELMVRNQSHCWRLDSLAAAAQARTLSFTDLRHGSQTFETASIGDVVLSRKDIGVAYHLAVVVDDAYQNVTHVTRGEDLLSSTPIHRVLQHLLGLAEPIYLHHRLILDASGKRLAKRHDALSIRHLRDQGMSPHDVLNMLPRDP